MALPQPTVRFNNGTLVRYDPELRTVSMSFPYLADKCLLNDWKELSQHFEQIEQFWRDHCGGQKVYWLVDFANLNIHESLRDLYATTLKSLFDRIALLSVRYGGTIQQRATIRFYALKTAAPLHLYATREEAIQAIAAAAAEARHLKLP